MPKYSIVVPLHNEQENVTDLYDRLKATMETNGETFELVLVDDGSADRTFHMLREIAAVDCGAFHSQFNFYTGMFGKCGQKRRTHVQ